MSVEPGSSRTPSAAIAKRRDEAVRSLQRISRLSSQLQNAGVLISRAEFARLAKVSRSFVYQNEAARSAFDAYRSHFVSLPELRASRAASEVRTWRARALNAERANRDMAGVVDRLRQELKQSLGLERYRDSLLGDRELVEVVVELRESRAKLMQAAKEIAGLKAELNASRRLVSGLLEEFEEQ